MLKLKIGINEDTNQLFVQHLVVGNKDRNEINYNASSHIKGLQSSNYIQIDDSLETIKEYKEMKLQALRNFNRKAEIGIQGRSVVKTNQSIPKFEIDNFHLKYCKPEDVNKNRQQLIKAKATFLAKISNIGFNGDSQMKYEKIHEFIDQNIDDLYKVEPQVGTS